MLISSIVTGAAPEIGAETSYVIKLQGGINNGQKGVSRDSRDSNSVFRYT
jgi:hypothetical protein